MGGGGNYLVNIFRLFNQKSNQKLRWKASNNLQRFL